MTDLPPATWTPADRVTLVLAPHPSRSPNGTMRFDAFLDGELVCTSDQPLFDGARALLDAGYPPATLLTTRTIGAGFDNIIPAPMGKLAGMATVENNRDLGFAKYRPFIAPRGGPSMRKSASEVSGQPPEEIALYGEPVR